MLAVIGGTGFYQIDGLEIAERREVKTPFGEPSAPLTFAKGGGETTIFLPRHGDHHQYLPSEVNYRANIWALKEAGARQVIAVSAVGSLREEIAPGDFITPSQYFDFTKGIRARTFFGGGVVAHISSANPACPNLTSALAKAADELKIRLHKDKVYACVEGPRLGTRAESFFLRDSVRADIVGMTNVPEVFLAREAQLCYATLAIATDYDCWMDDPSHHATVEMVIARFGESIARAKSLVHRLLDAPPPFDDAYRRALDSAILTPESSLTESHKQLLAVLLK